MPELAYVNGTFCPIAEATVSIEDRGFQFGDGVYEVIVAYDGRLFQLPQHLQRLQRSAGAIKLSYDFQARPLEPIIEAGLPRCGFAEAMVYVQLTRGVAPRVLASPDTIEPTVVMTFKARPEVSETVRRQGIKLMTVPDTRWSNCYVKAITLLPNVMAKMQAISGGYDDAIFVAANGEVRECTSSNVFMAQGGKLVFPPRTESVLHGVTQRFLLECAAGIGVECVEETFSVERLRSADEVFISSTAVEVLGVTSIDDRPIADGRIGPITQRLFAEFNARVRTSIGSAS